MKNIYIIFFIAILVLGLGYFFLSKDVAPSSTQNMPSVADITELDLTPPSRPSELNGSVTSVEGNVVVIANEVGKEQLSDAERAERKAEMQLLSSEERQALRQQELEDIETIDVEIKIPVGIPISKGSGDASGDNVSAEISDISKGTYISVWLTDGKTPEFVKIKGLGQ